MPHPRPARARFTVINGSGRAGRPASLLALERRARAERGRVLRQFIAAAFKTLVQFARRAFAPSHPGTARAHYSSRQKLQIRPMR